jgi:putative aminopeptidase FrvX
MVLNENKFVCRAIDNRMGGFMIAEVALAAWKQSKITFGPYITNSVQEEVGLRGAEMIYYQTKCSYRYRCMPWFYYSNDWQKNEGDTQIGKGPVVTYAPAVQNNLRELILTTAEEKKIPFVRFSRYRNRYWMPLLIVTVALPQHWFHFLCVICTRL